MRDGIKSGDHRTLDVSIDEGKWFAAKAIKENCNLKDNKSVVSLPLISKAGWHSFRRKISFSTTDTFTTTRWNPSKM